MTMPPHESESARRHRLHLTDEELRAVIVTLELARLQGLIPKHLHERARAVEDRAARLYGRRAE